MPLLDCRATVFFHTVALVQFAAFGRSSFHLLRPVATSRPAAKDSLSFSLCTTSVPSSTTGDCDIPRLLLALA